MNMLEETKEFLEKNCLRRCSHKSNESCICKAAICLKEIENTEQALLKSQEQESKIKILKEHRKDYLSRLKNLEEYSLKQEKVLEIIKEKCIGTENLFYAKIAEDYDDYLSLFEDKIEEQYLLTQEEFNLLKRWSNEQSRHKSNNI